MMGGMVTGETWRLGRRPALDGLRGVSILLVVASHAAPGHLPGTGAGGVAVFFALSGFLITSLLLDEHEETGRISIRGFYLRRARRLFPALAVFLFTVTLFHVVGVPVMDDLRYVLAAVFYAGNWVEATGHPMGQINHTWSLAVEEQFYLLFPLLVVALVGRSRRALVTVVALIAFSSLALRLGLWATDLATIRRVYYGTDTVACLLLVGCLTAFAVRRHRPTRPHPWLVAACLVVTAVVSSVPDADSGLPWIPVVAAVLTCVVMWCLMADGEATGPLTTRWLGVVGQRSYGLYLWHLPLLLAGPVVVDAVFGPTSRWLSVPPLVALAWGITCLSWRYVEQPVMRAGSPPRRDVLLREDLEVTEVR